MTKIRLASSSDLDAILSVFSGSIEMLCKNDYTIRQRSAWVSAVKNRKRWLNKIETQFFLVSHENEKIIGFGSLTKLHEIDMMYIDPLHARQGVGASVLKRLEQQALKQKATQLTTQASITAVPFFKKQGFIIISNNKIERKGLTLVNHTMKKTLHSGSLQSLEQ